jgi:hypothetical protein
MPAGGLGLGSRRDARGLPRRDFVFEPSDGSAGIAEGNGPRKFAGFNQLFDLSALKADKVGQVLFADNANELLGHEYAPLIPVTRFQPGGVSNGGF